MDLDSEVSAFDPQSDGSDFAPEVKARPVKPPAAAKKPTAAKKPAAKKTQTTLKALPKKRKPDSDDEDSNVYGDGASPLAVTPPAAKKPKKAAATKKSSANPLAEIENDSVLVDGGDEPPKPSKTKTATETYQRLTQLQHIIKRPDTYIGSVERTDQQLWVFNKETGLMVQRIVSFVPGLYKIFDEILVNAADNKQNDASMTYIKVTINRETGEISVENNGKGIPVVIHEKEQIYIPEMIFGHLLTGSNYDDDEKRTVGGRNGYGAKLCNIFSTTFTLEVQDSENGKRYKQTWHDNMSKMDKAKITSNKSSDFVRVTFMPDYKRFGMPEGIDDDLESLLTRRVYDMAGTVVGVKVYLNGDLIKIKNFKAYCEMYSKAIAKSREVEDASSDNYKVFIDDEVHHRRWEVGFAVSDGSFQQVSFVNNIATTSGGTHTNYIADQICGHLIKHLDKKKKGHALKANHVRNHIFIFVRCLINNPAFTSQTKEQLTTKVSQFGSRCTLTDKFLAQIVKTDAINDIMAFAEKKADKLMAKSDGNKRSRINNAKLVDANLAGTRYGHQCTLILTEGDSARGLAVAGRAVLDPDRIGVFPLRGKMLNVRDASIDQITKNQEIQNIKQFLGLKHKQEYTDTKSLRYGHLMIMADQDHDGSHIKGLLINFLQVQFPSLLKIEGFFQEFITPIVKVWQGPNPKKPLRLRSFYTLPQYEAWKEAHRNEKWEHKYYKGLGTSQPEDAQVYFTNLDDHLKGFNVMEPEETELFELAFSKKKADARKEWLGNFVPGTYLDHSSKQIAYKDFVNRELILFSMADNMRSIPSVIDGFKPGQRKVMYACFKRNLVKDQKVIELAGYVSEQAAYHHGDVSLQQTIVGLAQTFVGSNNVNVLEPSGNFGSRLAGGSDAASARYIYTRLSPFARKVFSSLDEPILEHNFDEGHKIEPKTYAPIIPMVLVNGADGIGTGWSTSIPNYHPLDIVNNLRRRMGRLEPGNTEEQPFVTMMPWFRGWKGTCEAAGPDRYKFNGIAQQSPENPNEVVVSELPIRMWTDDFKARLEEVIRAEKTPSYIKDYREFNDHKHVHFIIQMDEKHMAATLKEGILERFKLLKQIATSNLVAFDTSGRIRKYEKVEDILEEYYQFRFKAYTERKKYCLGVLEGQHRKLSNQARFIKEIIEGKLVVSKKKKLVLVEELRQRKYDPFPREKKATRAPEDEDEDEDEEASGSASDFDYLLGMAIYSLTLERYEKLLKQIEEKKAEYDALELLSEKDLWCKDLDDFVDEWEKQLKLEEEIQTGIRRMGRRASTKIGVGAGKGKKAAKKDDEYMPTKPKAKTATTTQKAGQRLVEKLNAKPVKKEDDFDLSDDDFAALTRDRPAAASRTKRAAATKARTYLDDDDDDDDDFGGGGGGDDGDSSDDDRLLGDVGAMVKGIGLPSGTGDDAAASGGRLSLFAMSRPESSHGVREKSAKVSSGPTASKAIASVQSVFDLDSNDDTNYEMLARSSPLKSAAAAGGNQREVDDFLLSDDSDAPPVAAKPKAAAVAAKPASASASDVPPVKKGRGRPAGSKNKAKEPGAAAATKGGAAGAKAMKQTTLSPAAKAYAKRQEAKKIVALDSDDDDKDDDNDDDRIVVAKKGSASTVLPARKKAPSATTAKPTAAAKKAKKFFDSDVDEDDDMQMEDSLPPAKPAGRGRPARSAAAAKSKYVVDDDDDEDDSFGGGGGGGGDDTGDFDDSD